MDLHNFKQWARRKLGDGLCGVKVELDDKQLEQALDEAKEWFSVYMGLYREGTLSIVAGQSDYDLSGVTPGVESISNVWFPSHGYQVDYSMMYPGFLDVNGFPYTDSGLGGATGFPQSGLVQSMQTLESTARILSMDSEWEYVDDRMTEPPTKKLRVMAQPQYSGTAVYLYLVDPKDIKLKHYRQRDLLILRDYAFALVKYTLGRIRGKYTSGLPVAGGDRTLDGEALISEAREDMQRLEDKILDYQGPPMPVIG